MEWKRILEAAYYLSIALVLYIGLSMTLYPLAFLYAYHYIAENSSPKKTEKLVFDDIYEHNFTLSNLLAHANTKVEKLYVYAHTVDGGFIVLSDRYVYPTASLVLFIATKTIVEGEPRIALYYNDIRLLNITADTLYIYTCIPEYVEKAFPHKQVIVLENPLP